MGAISDADSSLSVRAVVPIDLLVGALLGLVLRGGKPMAGAAVDLVREGSFALRISSIRRLTVVSGKPTSSAPCRSEHMPFAFAPSGARSGRA